MCILLYVYVSLVCHLVCYRMCEGTVECVYSTLTSVVSFLLGSVGCNWLCTILYRVDFEQGNVNV